MGERLGRAQLKKEKPPGLRHIFSEEKSRKKYTVPVMQRQSLTTSYKQTAAQLVSEQRLLQKTNSNPSFNVIEVLTWHSVPLQLVQACCFS